MYTLVVLATLLCSAAADELPTYGIIGYKVIDVPYHVSIEYEGGHHCSGAILSTNIVLTTVSCVDKLNPEQLTVRVGTFFAGYAGDVVMVSKYITHPQFDPQSLDYDIAVVRLSQFLQFKNHVKPVKLPKQGEVLKRNAVGTVSGWVPTRNSSPLSVKLDSTEISLVDKNFCMQVLNGVTDRMFCAGTSQVVSVDQHPCKFDKGGPFVVDEKLFGMISWGVNCKRAQFPGVYTNIPELRTWIDETIAYIL